MATIRKIKQGYAARRNGQAFENAIINQARYNLWHIVQIPMGAKMINASRMVRVITPFDFIMYKEGDCIALDAKSTTADKFNASKITPHQIFNLKKIEDEGFCAGYIVNFSELKKVVFFSATKLSKMAKRSSLKPEDGTLLGSISNIDFKKIKAESHNLDLDSSRKTLGN